jgi:hypothetical protein
LVPNYPILLLNLQDTDKTFFADFRYNNTFDPAKAIKGIIYNIHDPNAIKITPTFAFVYFGEDKKQYIGVYVSDKVPKATELYKLDLTYNGTNQSFSLRYPLGNTLGMVTCVHDLDLTKTRFNSNPSMTIVNVEYNLGTFVLQTNDKNLYNYKIDMSRFQVQVSPYNTTAKFYITEHPTVEGIYNLMVSSTVAEQYTLNVNIDKTSVLKDYIVTVKSNEAIYFANTSDLNKYDSVITIDNSLRLTSATTDNGQTIYFTGADSFNNVITYDPNANNQFLGVNIQIVIDNTTTYNFSNDKKSIIFIYNSSKKVYQVSETISQIGNYAVSITGQNGKALKYSYKKAQGSVNYDNSYAYMNSSANIEINSIATVNIILKDTAGFNLLTNSNAADTNTQASLLQISAVNGSTKLDLTFQSVDLNMNVFSFASDKIKTIGTYTLNITYDGKIISCSNCVFNVIFDAFDINRCKMSVILDKIIQMSMKSTLQINNQKDLPLFNFDFYDSNGIKLQIVDKSSNLKAVFSGADLGPITLKSEWVGDNHLLWSFPEAGLLSSIVGANYSITYYLKVYYNSLETLVYPIQLSGNGEDIDAGNGDANLKLTAFSSNEIRLIAGTSSTLSLEFRTNENLRVNKKGDISLFNFSNSLQLTKGFSVTVQYGAKLGTYILTVYSEVATDINTPIVITISYSGIALSQNLNVYVQHSSLSLITLDESYIVQDTTLQDANVINPYTLKYKCFDKYGNSFLEILDNNLWPMERIQKLFNYLHTNGSTTWIYARTDLNTKFIFIDLYVYNIGTVKISSTFIPNKVYSLAVYPGPLATATTSGVIDNANNQIVAGEIARLKVYPRDKYNNKIKLTQLSDAEYNSITATVIAANGTKITIADKSKDTGDDSILFKQKITVSGTATLQHYISDTPIICNNCQLQVILDKPVFTNSILVLSTTSGQTEVSQTNFNLDKSVLPSLNFYLDDQFMNTYIPLPSDYTLTAKFEGNNSNITFCVEKDSDKFRIFVCRDSTNKYNWMYLLAGSGFILTINNGTDSLVYNITLVGGSNDTDASNAPVDISKTYFQSTTVTATAGVMSQFTIELRTAESKRWNFWYENPETMISVKFSIGGSNYKHSVVTGEKPGQYYLNISSTKVFTVNDNNRITVNIEGKDCLTTTPLFIVNPNVPVIAKYYKGNDELISLPVSTADSQYSIKMILYDTYGNISTLPVEEISYAISHEITSEKLNSVLVLNSDNSYLLTFNPTISGNYLLTGKITGNQSFYINPGVPNSDTSFATITVTNATAGDSVNVYIVAHDQYNNYIPLSNFNLSNNPFQVTFRYKGANNDLINDITISSVTIGVYVDNNGNKLDAFVYSQVLTVSHQNFFRITYNNATEIKCLNCIVDVTPASFSFTNFYLARYDSSTGSFVELKNGSSEDNTKVDLIYRLYPRDQYGNQIDVVTNLGKYFVIIMKDGIIYHLKINNIDDGLQAFIEFVKDDANNGDITYNTMVSGVYNVVFSNGLEKIERSITLIGQASDIDASNQPLEPQNTVVIESNLQFTAGQTGYLMIETRTVNSLRKNNWLAKVAVLSKSDDITFTATTRNAGKPGVYYITISSNKANSVFGTLTAQELIIKVNDIQVKNLTPSILVTPAAMSKAYVLDQYIKPPMQLVDGNVDVPYSFKVGAFDRFGNPTTCDVNVLSLSASSNNDNNKGIMNVSSGIDVTNGCATYTVDNSIAGTIVIKSKDVYGLPLYQFVNLPGKLDTVHSNINIAEKNIDAGQNGSVQITPMDKFGNLIPVDKIDLKTFKAKVIQPNSNNPVDLEVKINENGNGLIAEKQFNIAGLLKFILLINDIEKKCSDCTLTVHPAWPVFKNSKLMIENQYGVVADHPVGTQIFRNNKNPIAFKLSLRDQFFNSLSMIPSTITMLNVTLSGNDMTLITLDINANSGAGTFDVSMSKDAISAFNRIVSGSGYKLIFTLDDHAGGKQDLEYPVTVLSDVNDSGYGNGPYVVENTEVSKTDIQGIPAGSVYTLNIRLKTAKMLYYNNDIDVSNIKIYITPEDSTFSYTVYKKATQHGDYNIDISTKKANVQFSLTMTINDYLEQTPKELQKITLTAKPKYPPAAEKTIVKSKPDSKINAGSNIVVTVQLKDEYDNLYNNDSAILDHLLVTNNNAQVDTAKKLLKPDGITYEFSYIPAYPPRTASMNIFYHADNNQVTVLSKPIVTNIISEPYWANTVVSSTNLTEMKAGSKLNIQVNLFDQANVCLDPTEAYSMIVKVSGPSEAILDSQKINYSYNFETVTKNNKDCKFNYVAVVPDNQIYTVVGTYQITVTVGPNNYEAKSVIQKLVPDDVDITKFVSIYNMPGAFNSGSVKAGTELNFSIQGNDKYGNKVVTSINKLKVDVLSKTNDLSFTASDYSVSLIENTPGLINGKIKITKTGSYKIKYLYENVELATIDNSKGPSTVNIVPEACRGKYPTLDLSIVNKASTGLPTSFTITCKDTYGNKISTGGESFLIYLTVTVLETKTISDVKTIVTDNSNGSYTVNFIPPLSGEYLLNIDLNGEIYGGINRFVINSTVCTETTPFSCPNKLEKCVSDTYDCIEKDVGYKCNRDQPFYCSVNGTMTCVKSQTMCDCPKTHFKSSFMSYCIPNNKHYMDPFFLPINCSKIYPSYPIQSTDGICRLKQDDKPSQRVCPIGFVLCPDLTCRDNYSNCTAYDECASKSMVRCSNQSCVKDQKDCPGTIICPSVDLVVCPDGTCVNNEIKCKPLPKCIAPNNVLCPDNSCVSDIKSCPKSIACGHGLALCSDMSCKPTCLK